MRTSTCILKLPPAVAPLRSIPGREVVRQKHLFAAGPRAVVAVPLDQTAETVYAPTDLFTHAADLRTGFVAVGPFAVAVYGPEREPLWVFRVPATDRLPNGPPPFRVLLRSRSRIAPHLSSFVLAGTWLLARSVSTTSSRLDLSARRVAWVLDSAARARYEPNQFPGTARFGSHFAVNGKFIVAQLSDGRRWFVELRTGPPGRASPGAR